MSNDKSRLLANLKKTLAVGLPVMAISGFVPTALTVGAAQAEAETKVVAEAEGKYAEAKSEAEGKYAEAKSEAEGEAKHAHEAKAEAEGEAKAEAEKK